MLDLESLGRLIIGIGFLLIIIGLVILSDIELFSWFGNLPGDIRIERDNFNFYFPITTMVILSIILNLVLRIINYIF
ncbi:DUF2905 domain-containing protein [Halanaerobiaceae bacterium Z-7014]|uniref:DUF2905 domain-containing protein n=1 Tax=Halonatronomonas betaini TaxID=2778430 RepID=A0A931ARJ7_9FIRM|nr:DUF2905 domain-containing protein [Halonatronomonas betaini]